MCISLPGSLHSAHFPPCVFPLCVTCPAPCAFTSLVLCTMGISYSAQLFPSLNSVEYPSAHYVFSTLHRVHFLHCLLFPTLNSLHYPPCKLCIFHTALSKFILHHTPCVFPSLVHCTLHVCCSARYPHCTLCVISQRPSIFHHARCIFVSHPELCVLPTLYFFHSEP